MSAGKPREAEDIFQPKAQQVAVEALEHAMGCLDLVSLSRLVVCSKALSASAEQDAYWKDLYQEAVKAGQKPYEDHDESRGTYSKRVQGLQRLSWDGERNLMPAFADPSLAAAAGYKQACKCLFSHTCQACQVSCMHL
jgi:hypothetical protein